MTTAAARHLKLDAAHTTIERFAGERVLAVRRYDRFQEAGRWLRTHQEDLCQALNVPLCTEGGYRGLDRLGT